MRCRAMLKPIVGQRACIFWLHDTLVAGRRPHRRSIE